MTIQTIFEKHIPKLKKISPTAELDVEVLLAYVLKRDRVFVISHTEYELTGQELKSFNGLYAKRLKYYPIALLTGEKEFYGLSFTVSPSTCIPRPETELFIDACLQLLTSTKEKKISVLDIGTGTGCIPITLFTKFPNASYTAVDISERTLTLAKKNAKKHKAHINFKKSNLFSSVKGTYDIITANLPYVPNSEYRQNKFLKYEPKQALTDGKDGTTFIIKAIAQLPKYLKANGHAFFEIHPSQVDKLKAEAKKYNLFVQRTIYDHQNLARVLDIIHQSSHTGVQPE